MTKLLKLRKSLGSQQAVADAIHKEFTDCSQQSICDWETGRIKAPRWYGYFLKILVDRATEVR